MLKKIILISLILFTATLGFSQIKAKAPATKSAAKAVTYMLTVSSNTKSYSVFIDGNLIKGNRVSLRRGSYYVEVKADGFQDYAVNVELTRNKVIKANLKRAKKVLPANISISIPDEFMNADATGTDGQIYVYDNGNLLRGLTFSVKPGNHTIRIESGAFVIEDSYDFLEGQSYIVEPFMYLNIE
ncbi:MAG: PEGA domain-containing protein [Spirochaetaceae bacterium]